MKQTLRFNRVFPGLLIAVAFIGTVTLGIPAVSSQIELGPPWIAVWLATSHLVVGAILLASAYRLATREDAPDCRPLYLASGAAVALVAMAGLSAYFFPAATARAPSMVLNLLAPKFGQEFDRLEEIHRDVAASLSATTAASRGTESGN